jgi:hypothetical protein
VFIVEEKFHAIPALKESKPIAIYQLANMPGKRSGISKR